MKLKFAMTDISLNETPRKIILSKDKQGQKGHSFFIFMFFVSLCLWDGNFDCNTNISAQINQHPLFSPGCKYLNEKERLGFHTTYNGVDLLTGWD